MPDQPECSHLRIRHLNRDQLSSPLIHWVCEDCGARLHPAIRAVDTTQEYLPTVTRQHHTEMLMEKNNEINRLKAELKRLKELTAGKVILANLTKGSIRREEDGTLLVGGGDADEHIFGPEEVCWFEWKCHGCGYSWKEKSLVGAVGLRWVCPSCGGDLLLTIK